MNMKRGKNDQENWENDAIGFWGTVKTVFNDSTSTPESIDVYEK
jgi:hypothetical protein